jgi:hypothetical protein
MGKQCTQSGSFLPWTIATQIQMLHSTIVEAWAKSLFRVARDIKIIGMHIARLL